MDAAADAAARSSGDARWCDLVMAAVCQRAERAPIRLNGPSSEMAGSGHRRRLEQAVASLRAATAAAREREPELRPDVRDVPVHGVRAEEEPLGDPRVVQALATRRRMSTSRGLSSPSAALVPRRPRAPAARAPPCAARASAAARSTGPGPRARPPAPAVRAPPRTAPSTPRRDRPRPPRPAARRRGRRPRPGPRPRRGGRAAHVRPSRGARPLPQLGRRASRVRVAGAGARPGEQLQRREAVENAGLAEPPQHPLGALGRRRRVTGCRSSSPSPTSACG